MSTIAFIGPGDLGTRLAAILAGAGHATLTTLEGRGARSRALCEERGLTTVDSLAEAVARADIVVCAVPPDAALEAARAFAAVLPATRAPVYVDANSISPERGREIAALVEAAGAPAASATVHGSGEELARTGQIFLSGAAAEHVAGVVGDALRVVRLGADPGRAKELKLLVAAMSKGLCALWMETGSAAARAGLLDETEAALRHAYPTMMADLDRMVPTYGRHSPRRMEELEALAALESAHDVDPRMARATLAMVHHVADEVRKTPLPPDGEPWTSSSLIRRLART